MNKVNLIGRLVKDPEMKYTPSNVAVATFTMAVDRGYVKQGEERQADFINVVVWRNTAEFVSKYFSKGKMIAISGRIQTRSYDNSEGKRHYITEVIADEVYFCGDKSNGNSNINNSANDENSTPEFDAGGFTDYVDDELPF